MEPEEKALRAGSFGEVATAYAEHRPGYPAAAVEWLVGSRGGRVLELGSGTGKLTTALVGLGHDVVATDPSERMIAHLRSSVRAAHCLLARAEDIPLPSSQVDVVVSAQAFHWFDLDRALPEIARVLRPGGVLAVVWNVADHKVPWVKKVFSLFDPVGDDRTDDDPVAGSKLFATSDRKIFRHWQQFHRDSLVGFVASQSRVVTMNPEERAEVLTSVGEIYDSYGRGPDGMLMPWMTMCYRARVTGLADTRRETRPDLDDGLLIDFN
jgi:SAM-dependent methyltransferase